MQSSFTILVNGATPSSWPKIIWTDAKKEGATFCHDYCKPIPAWLRQARKVHFSNPANRKLWLPLKCLWDWTNILRPEQLDSSKRNYIIFQTGIKYSARYIKKLKEERNACIVLYMPDTIHAMSIASNRKEFERYCLHYQIDQAYSFDPEDCERFGMKFFDIYSVCSDGSDMDINRTKSKHKVLYVGSCRSRERLDMVHRLYEYLSKQQCECTFYLNGVSRSDQYFDNIIYNHPLSYAKVVELVKQNDMIIEIMNGSQTGNTLRYKEAVCYNKLLLTNNKNITVSSYYNPLYMQMFSSVDDIKLTAFGNKPDYHYMGDFSPKRLMGMIVKNDIKI